MDSGAEATAPTEATASRGAAFKILRLRTVDVALPDQFAVATLEEAEPQGRTLRIRVGMAEGVALAHALAGTAPPRPSTHDLFSHALRRIGVEVLAVRLVGRRGGLYLAELELVGPSGREELECRPSDGIALALRQRVPAPILAEDRLLGTDGDVVPRPAPPIPTER